MRGVSLPTMSSLVSVVSEDKLLLTLTLIDVALLAILLLIALKNSTSAARSYTLACLVFTVILYLFLQHQYLNASEPNIETLPKTRH